MVEYGVISLWLIIFYFKKVESAILYDSVFLVYNALETLNARNQDNPEGETIDPVPLSCEGEEKYNAGPNITNVIREVKLSWNLKFFSESQLKV